MRRAHILIAALWLLAHSAACKGTNGAEVCNNLNDNCSAEIDLDDCRKDAEKVERAAEKASCNSTLDDYLDCLEDNGCNWKTACAGHRSNLENCSGEFP